MQESTSQKIQLKRAYEPATDADGLRVLVDRLWARGVSKQEAQLNAWMKDLGPSNQLREWFGHRADRWDGFQDRYRSELAAPLRQLFLALLQSAAGTSKVTLVYGARDTHQNEAVVLRDYLISHTVPTPGNREFIVLAAVEAVAAAQPDRETSTAQLTPFVGSLLSNPERDAALLTLSGQGEIRQESGGWLLASRGKRVLQGIGAGA